jgi:hypothetical protein
MPTNYQLTQTANLLICANHKAALKALGGDTTRIFDATPINLHRIGYAIYDMTCEGLVAPEFKTNDEGRIAIKRGAVIDRVYFADGYWHIDRMKARDEWDMHPAVKIACKLFAKTPDYTEQMPFSAILATQKAMPKHVFLALMGTNQPFAVIGKPVAVKHAIAEGVHTMQMSAERV